MLSQLLWAQIPLILPIASTYGIFTYMKTKKSTIHLGKYTSHMDAMGYITTFKVKVVPKILLTFSSFFPLHGISMVWNQCPARRHVGNPSRWKDRKTKVLNSTSSVFPKRKTAFKTTNKRRKPQECFHVSRFFLNAEIFVLIYWFNAPFYHQPITNVLTPKSPHLR